MNRFLDWLDDRSGIRGIVKEALYEKVPGGARWRYVWGSCLTFAFFTQVVTGTLLWMSYSPSAQTAWESVYFIQYEVWGGWFLRGVHHYMAQAMIVLLVLHLMQVMIDGAYKAPRELNFWFGIALLGVTLALSLTGYLLPWDQKGFWATAVATNLIAEVPLIGPILQKIVVGGVEYGHQTITRFFALHAGILPAALIGLVVAHIYLFRKHGIHVKEPRPKKDSYFWPDQILKDGVACLAVMLAVIILTLYFKGAPLGPPADPSNEFPARPEWYFLFLFQLLKYVPAFWGAVIIPLVLGLLILIQPFLGASRKGHQFNIGFWWCLLAGAAGLTFLAFSEDRANTNHGAAVKEAEWQASRVVQIAQEDGIPPAGAVTLLRNDHENRGRRIFAAHCASCHRYNGHDGRGYSVEEDPSAPELAGFASQDWLTKLLNYDHYTSIEYFGGTAFKDGTMAKKVLKKYNKEEQKLLPQVAILLSDQAELPYQESLTDEKRESLMDIFYDDLACIDCHDIDSEGEGSAPDLTGYGSKKWMTDFIINPEHERFYGKKNDRMPAYGRDNKLSPEEIEIVVDWIRLRPAVK
ncbi:MAG: cytochrome b N-terminal domain-containing protein [Opitutales bacterium]|nr:cytochrome b N-terminal domain-containing protein [Opitutales bacterium]